MKILIIALLALGALAPPSMASEGDAAQKARWNDLSRMIFGERSVEDGKNVIRLSAPSRALDAALVPIGVSLLGDKPVKSIYLVIDNNPSPLAAHFTFGPAADPHELQLRVRIDQYTLLHAVAETMDGRLYQTASFVKAAGGCSAPAGSDDEAALKDIGHMKLRLTGQYAPGKPLQAQLLIRHPNFNGMQMNQVTRNYTPAWFAQNADVTYDGQLVFHLDSDISLSTDPAIGFGFVPNDRGQLKVIVRDSKAMIYTSAFDVPGQQG